MFVYIVTFFQHKIVDISNQCIAPNYDVYRSHKYKRDEKCDGKNIE